MKLLSLALCVLAIAPLSASQYVGLEFGANHVELTDQDKNPKIGYIAGVKYGYDFDNGVRVELASHYRKNVKSTQYIMGDEDQILSKHHKSLHSWSYMANCLYDITQISVKTFVPYVGIGVGYCQNTEHNTVKYDKTERADKLKDNRFAYQGIIGARYALNPDYSSSIEYQYFCGQSHAKHHTVNLSLNRHF